MRAVFSHANQGGVLQLDGLLQSVHKSAFACSHQAMHATLSAHQSMHGHSTTMLIGAQTSEQSRQTAV